MASRLPAKPQAICIQSAFARPISGTTGSLPPWLGATSASLTHWLILMVMVAVGLGLDLSSMRKVGWNCFYLGLTIMGVMSGVSLLLITFLRIS